MKLRLFNIVFRIPQEVEERRLCASGKGLILDDRPGSDGWPDGHSEWVLTELDQAFNPPSFVDALKVVEAQLGAEIDTPGYYKDKAPLRYATDMCSNKLDISKPEMLGALSQVKWMQVESCTRRIIEVPDVDIDGESDVPWQVLWMNGAVKKPGASAYSTLSDPLRRATHRPSSLKSYKGVRTQLRNQSKKAGTVFNERPGRPSKSK
jgi:hypothetical protein